MVFGASFATLDVALDESSFFLRPSSKPDLIPSDDPVICGRISLRLPKAKRIKSLLVRVVCEYTVVSPVDFSQDHGERVISEAQLCDGSTGRLFVAGEHDFLFTLVVSSSVAPTERCGFGSIDYKVVAIAHSDSLINSTASSSVPISLVVNPAPIGETSGLYVCLHGFRDALGPYLMRAASQHFTVGGLVSFDYRLANVPSRLSITSISALVKTTYTVKSMNYSLEKEKKEERTRKSVRCTPIFEYKGGDTEGEDTKLDVLCQYGVPVPRYPQDSTAPEVTAAGAEPGRVPFQRIPAYGSLHFTHLARLPDDHVLRPSTLEGTETPIEISHQLVLEMRFSRMVEETGRETNFVLSMSNAITLSSCYCMLPSLLVPSYSEATSHPECSDLTPPYASSAPMSKSLSSSSTSSSTSSQSSSRKSRTHTRPTPPARCICSSSKAQLLEQGRKTDVRLGLLPNVPASGRFACPSEGEGHTVKIKQEYHPHTYELETSPRSSYSSL